MFLETPKGDIVNVDQIVAVNLEYLSKTTIAVYTDTDIVLFEYDDKDDHYEASGLIERCCLCAYPRWALAGVQLFRADKIKSIVQKENTYATIAMQGTQSFQIKNHRVEQLKQGLSYRMTADSKPNLVKAVF